MRVEGEVPLELVVWFSTPAAESLRVLAEAAPTIEWRVEVDGRMRLRVRGGVADVEPRVQRGGAASESRGAAGQPWMGLFTGRVNFSDAGDSGIASRRPFAAYANEQPDPPLRLETCWFATDTDGRVACFDRHQLGAAPMKRAWGPRPEPPLVQRAPDAIAREIEGAHAQTKLPARTFGFLARARELAAALARGVPPALVRRWSLTLVDDARVLASLATSAEGPHAEPLSVFAVQWLHVRGVCDGCLRASLTDHRLRGAYLYQHRVRTRATPYDRVGEPNAPWSIAEAAAALGLAPDALARSTLPLRFADKDRLQPIEYVPCTWSDTVPWESESGERHAGTRA